MRQYNKVGQPYIGPSVKCLNNKVCATSEYILLTENIATYMWILLMQAHTVPVFSIGDIRLIFGNGNIIDTLLI